MNLKDGEWETPDELYEMLCSEYKVRPKLDVCATKKNKKCRYFFSKVLDGLTLEWDMDAWCNPPHDNNEAWVKKAFEQWGEYDITIMMILPANSICTNYASKYILDYAEYYPINRSFCKFLREKKELHGSRNGYFVVIWRKK